MADSQQSAYYRNLTSWNELCNYFGDHFVKLPKVLAFNKQDLPDKFNSVDFLDNINSFKFKNFRSKKTVALHGYGVVETFEKVMELILKKIYNSQIVSIFD